MTRTILFSLVVLVFAGCRAQIQHGLDERDANEVVSALVAHGFDAKKVAEKGKKPTYAVELDDDHATDALRVLTELKLPRPARTTTKDLASQTSLVETPATERMRQMEAQEGDLEQMLEGMDGVESASVELVVPAPPRPGQPAVSSKAAVLVRARPEALERLTAQRGGLQSLIAGAVDGLKADDVAVVLDPVVVRAPTPKVEAADAAPKFKQIAIALAAACLLMALLLMALTLKLHAAQRAVNAAQPKRIEPIATPAMSRPALRAVTAGKKAA
jgi:type III secretion protein J